MNFNQKPLGVTFSARALSLPPMLKESVPDRNRPYVFNLPIAPTIAY